MLQHEAYHETPMKDYYDGREQPVLIRDYPDPPLHLVASRPRVDEAATESSVHLALTAHRADRRQAIEDVAEDAAVDLARTSALDSLMAERVAVALLPLADEGRSVADRRQAGAVAVRMHDPRWLMVSRYRHAQQNFASLRTLLSRHGLSGCIADAELRACADGMAGAGWQARIAAFDASCPVGVQEWAASYLGFLNITEER
jgi:hypothetical protein